MEFEKVLKDFFEVIIKEVEKNEEFSKKLKGVIEKSSDKKEVKKKKTKKKLEEKDLLLNPYEILEEGNKVLENKLTDLELDDLKNIISYYAMDQTNSFKRLRKKERFISLILEVANIRINKGNAFRDN